MLDKGAVQIGTTTLTYDALGRMIEKAVGSSYTQVVYAPLGSKLALMNGQTLAKAFVPLTAGATAVYTSSGLAYYRHSDWLGSSRVASTPTRTKYYDGAYAPYGENYAGSGTTDLSFTSQNQDAASGHYDFLFREYNPVHGRWISPDPAGRAAVNPASPQSWNRYAYVQNIPTLFRDPLGLMNDCGGQICTPFSYSIGGGCMANISYYWITGEDNIEYQMPEISVTCSASVGPMRTAGGGNRGGGGRLLEAWHKLVHGLACTAVSPLVAAAKVTDGTVGTGYGGSGGIGILVTGVSASGSASIVADPKGNVGFAFTGGVNPGWPGTLGLGYSFGRQVLLSEARNLSDLNSTSMTVAGSLDAVSATVSQNPLTISVAAGSGKGAQAGTVEFGGTYVPESLTFNCNDID